MLESPTLDDRDFAQLMTEARRRLGEVCPGWTDLSSSDPGIALLEAFAFLTETLIFRHNRLPDAARVAFLRLLGTAPAPPAAAGVELRFTLAEAMPRPVPIPRGTRVTAAAAGGPAFHTAAAAVLTPGQTDARVPAYAAEPVEAELLGVSDGRPGQTFALRRPPVVAPLAGIDTLLLGVEAPPGERVAGMAAIEHGGRTFRLWREVASFAEATDDPFVYVADRGGGRITLAPALGLAADAAPTALAAVPAAGREVRAWYRRGGGEAANVAAGTLTVLATPLPGVSVTNPARATGGRAAEPLADALLRGPMQFLAQERAVTARDVEALAARVGGIARARAITATTLWRHARPGTVHLALVPDVPAAARVDGALPAALVAAHARDEVLAEVAAELDRRRTVGTQLETAWAPCKSVRVEAKLRLRREEDPDAARARVLRRLRATIAPLPAASGAPAWRFGGTLSIWDVYNLVRQEPAVVDVEDLRLCLDDVPDSEVAGLAADLYEPRTWYAGAGGRLFRSQDDGEGWEPVAHLEGERITRVLAQPPLLRDVAVWAGRVAAVTEIPADGRPASRVRLSADCGESWERDLRLDFKVFDVDWVVRDGRPALLLATDLGLYELAVGEGSTPVQLVVDQGRLDLGFYAVAVAPNPRGGLSVAVAARDERGVFLSARGGASATFKPIGLGGELVRVLQAAERGGQPQIWAGLAAVGTEAGKGVLRWEVTGSEDSPTGWRPFAQGWQHGSCYALAAGGDGLLAGTQRGGVVRLPLDAAAPAWGAVDVNSGLPPRTAGGLQPVLALAARDGGPVSMAGGAMGVFRSTDGAHSFAPVSGRVRERVTIPPTWLLASGEHAITVTSDEPGHP